MQAAASLAAKPPQAGQLLRVLGLAFAIAVGVGAVIGGGILRTPATVVASVPLIWLALSLWVIVGVHALLEANVIAELMTALPRSGGLFVPARAAFKESGGLLVGWTDWLAWTAAAGALAILSAEFLAMIVPALEPRIVPVALALLLAVVALNWLGVREGSRVQIIGSAAKFAFLVGLVVLILLSPGAPPETVVRQAPATLTLTGLIVAYQIIFGAYAGWNSGAYFAEEHRNPSRNIPRGMTITIISVTALYFLVSIALLHAMSAERLGESQLPVLDAVRPILGDFAAKLVAGGASVIALTCLNAQVMGAPRILYGMASERLFPAVALRVNRGGTPTIGLALTGGAALLLTLTGEFETVFLIMAALGVVPLIVCDLALFKLRRDTPDLPRPYRAKLYPFLPALVLLLDVAVLLAFLAVDWTSGLFIVAAIAVCVPIGLWMRRSAPEPIVLG